MRSISKLVHSFTAALCLLLLTFTLLPGAVAQETTGAIQGTVTDPTGAVVVGAKPTETPSLHDDPEVQKAYLGT